MMNNIKIEITEAETALVEKLFFEYNAINRILTFLASQPSIRIDYLDKYFSEAVEKNIELELTKKMMSDKYIPDKNKFFNYTFDFDNNAIIYTLSEE